MSGRTEETKHRAVVDSSVRSFFYSFSPIKTSSAKATASALVGAALLLMLALPGCSPFTAEEPPVADSTLVEVLIELHLAQGRAEVAEDPLPPAVRDSIFARHELDEDRFRSAMDYYASHPEEYVSLYDEVLNRLSAEQHGATRPGVRQ